MHAQNRLHMLRVRKSEEDILNSLKPWDSQGKDGLLLTHKVEYWCQTDVVQGKRHFTKRGLQQVLLPVVWKVHYGKPNPHRGNILWLHAKPGNPHRNWGRLSNCSSQDHQHTSTSLMWNNKFQINNVSSVRNQYLKPFLNLISNSHWPQ